MRNRLLLVIDAVLLVVAGVLAFQLNRTWTTPLPRPAARAQAAAAPDGVGTVPAPTPAATPPFATYAVVVERNLFSPNRTEAPPEPARPATAAAAPPTPKPRLYGVILLPDGKARAYLEDGLRRRVFGYSIGDAVGDSRVEQIQNDRVVLRRGGEVYEVLLRDPTKPKPAPAVPTAAPQPPGAPVPPGPPRVLGGTPSPGVGPSPTPRSRPVQPPGAGAPVPGVPRPAGSDPAQPPPASPTQEEEEPS